MDISSPLTPIKLHGELHETIWGGRNLATFAGKIIPAGMPIGESWETALDCKAINPPYAPHTLGELVVTMGERLLGWRATEVFGNRFPLLAKFLDAEQRLSVQVHPDDSYARTHEGGKLGKTETWYILHAEPGAELVLGLRRQSSPDEVRRAIAQESLEDLLHTFSIQSGDVVFVPAGTVHAIGAGVVLYELQEYSDVTYRLYDYGRLQANGKPRELHIERSLAVMSYQPAPLGVVTPVPVLDTNLDGERRILAACDYFVEEELRFQGTYTTATLGSSCHIITLLGGGCDLWSEKGRLALVTGDTAVIPAALGPYQFESGTGVRALLSYVPTPDDRQADLWRNGQRRFLSS
jgi:mannose-6-phosphate isomerase